MRRHTALFLECIMSRRAKANSRTIAPAAKLRGIESGEPRSFASGLLIGLGAASLMIAGEIPKPKIPLGSIDDDWRAVRGDIEAATRKYGSKAG